VILLRQGELSEGALLLEKSINMSGSPVAMRNLAALRTKQGRTGEASRLFTAAAEGGDFGAIHHVALEAKARGDLAGAERWFRTALNLGDSHANFHLYQIARSKNPTQGITWLRRGANADDEECLHELGKELEGAGDLDGAEELFRRLVDRRRDSDARRHLASVLKCRGQVEESIQLFLGLVREDPRDHESARDLANLLLGKKQLKEAKKLLRRAAESRDPASMFEFSLLLESQGHHGEAKMWLNRAAEVGSTIAMHNLGVYAHERDNIDEAERWFRRASESGRDRSYNNLALCLKTRGEYEEAERWYRKE
jgi:tetratricopeptide (TPR) repeat protein